MTQECLSPIKKPSGRMAAKKAAIALRKGAAKQTTVLVPTSLLPKETMVKKKQGESSPTPISEAPLEEVNERVLPVYVELPHQTAGRKFGLLLGPTVILSFLIGEVEKLIVEGQDKLVTQEVADLLQVRGDKLRLESKKHKYIRDWLQPIDSHKTNPLRWATADIYNRLLKARDYVITLEQ